MSHFGIMVIGENPEQQIAPYHQYECTGIKDKYVYPVDITEKIKADYEKETTNRLRDSEGNLYSYFTPEGEWDPRFSQTGVGTSSWERERKSKFVPPGFTDVQLPFKDVMTMQEFVHYWYGEYETVEFGKKPSDEASETGWIELDENGEVSKVFRFTNPNYKWDWYQIGGRWSDWLKMKPGKTGWKGERSWTNENQPIKFGYADQALKGDIDIKGMRDIAEKEAMDRWDTANAAAKGESWLPWEYVRDVKFPNNIKEARNFYNYQSTLNRVKEAMSDPWDGVDEYLQSRDEYVHDCRDKAMVLYAYVINGKWYSKGEMLMFGMSNDQVSQKEWNSKVNILIDSLPDDTLITIIDCHI